MVTEYSIAGGRVLFEDGGTNTAIDRNAPEKDNPDTDDAANFDQALRIAGHSNAVRWGLSITYDDVALEIDISEGACVLDAESARARYADETVHDICYPVRLPAVNNLSLTDGVRNDVYVHLPLTGNDDPKYVIVTENESPPGGPSLKICEVDPTAAAGSEVSEVNRGIAIVGREIDGPLVGSTPLRSFVGGDLTVDADGDLTVAGDIASGASFLEELSDVFEDTLANQPAPGTAGRWLFTTDQEGIWYDTGSAWELAADHPSNIGADDLGFDPATQTELNTHTSNDENPHTVTASQAGAIPNSEGAVTTTNLSFDPATQTELDNHAAKPDIHHDEPSPGAGITFGANNEISIDGAREAQASPNLQKTFQLAKSADAPDNEYADGVHIPHGKELRLYMWGVSLTDGTLPTGITLELRDPGGTVITSANTKHTAGNPIGTYSNASGATQTAWIAVVNTTANDYTAESPNADGVAFEAGYRVV